MASMSCSNASDGKRLETKPMNFYNADVDSIRETEYPMLKGDFPTSCQKLREAYNALRHDLP